MSGRLAGKIAVVTGAGQGIGRSAAVRFAEEGASVWAIDRNSATLANLATENPEIITAVLDVSDGAGIEELANRVGAMDVLFNCAGVVHNGSIIDCAEADWDQAMDVNVKSMYLMARSFIQQMIERGGGSIINMASVISSISGVPNRCAYGVSKAAVIGLTKAIAADLAGDGIRCNAIAPGTVQSPSLDDRLAAFDDPEATRELFISRQPLGRLGTTEEIAALALYLASDESQYATGSIYVIDGGMTL